VLYDGAFNGAGRGPGSSQYLLDVPCSGRYLVVLPGGHASLGRPPALADKGNPGTRRPLLLLEDGVLDGIRHSQYLPDSRRWSATVLSSLQDLQLPLRPRAEPKRVAQASRHTSPLKEMAYGRHGATLRGSNCLAAPPTVITQLWCFAAESQRHGIH
jgi:hypothetical protein